jgi:membrane protease YdiL (CAAX protease family)
MRKPTTKVGDPMTYSLRHLLVFLSLLLVISVPAQLPALLSGSVDDSWVVVIMWAPGLAALLTRLILNGTLKGFGWGFGSKFASTGLIAFFVPLIVCVFTYGPLWMTGVVMVDASAYSTVIGNEFGIGDPGFFLALLIVVVAGIILNSIVVLGEEIGWRGYLFPLLADRYGFRVAAISTGIIWSTWHIPGIFLGGYNAGGYLPLSAACFIVSLTGLSIIAGALVLRSGSLWPAVVLHASHNLFFQAVFDQMTIRSELSVLFTTEWGLGTAFVYGGLGLWCLKYFNARAKTPSDNLE